MFRDERLLEEGADAIAQLAASLRDDLGIADHSLVWNSDLAEALELETWWLRRASGAVDSAKARVY